MRYPKTLGAEEIGVFSFRVDGGEIANGENVGVIEPPVPTYSVQVYLTRFVPEARSVGVTPPFACPVRAVMLNPPTSIHSASRIEPEATVVAIPTGVVVAVVSFDV